MNKFLSLLTALLLVMALTAASFAAPAKKKKPSAEHVAALKKCTEDYQAAMKEARTKKGKERKDAETAARQARKQCVANAPK